MTSYYRNDPDPLWEKHREIDPGFFDEMREYALTEYDSSLTNFLEENGYEELDDDFFMMRDEGTTPKEMLDSIYESFLAEKNQKYSGYYLKKFPH